MWLNVMLEMFSLAEQKWTKKLPMLCLNLSYTTLISYSLLNYPPYFSIRVNAVICKFYGSGF